MTGTMTSGAPGLKTAILAVLAIYLPTPSEYHYLQYTQKQSQGTDRNRSQFTWDKNPNWSHFYSGSEEIWRYMKDVAVKHGVDKYVKFNTTVESATWDEDIGLWCLQIVGPDGSRFKDTCNVLVNGSGVLKYVLHSDLPNHEQVVANDEWQLVEMAEHSWN